MDTISNTLLACGNVPKWFLTILFVAAISMAIIETGIWINASPHPYYG